MFFVHRNREKGEQAMRIEVMQPTGHLNATSTNWTLDKVEVKNG